MNGDREAQVHDLLPLVRRMARRVRRMVPNADLDDLIGDGSIGLLRAVDAFDSSYGVTIERYAARVVIGSMLNGLRRLDPVSERVRRTVRIGEQQRFAIAQEMGTLPTHVEMERRLPGLRRARFEAFRCTPLSLDMPSSVGDQVDADPACDPQQIYVRNAERARIRGALEALPARQRDIMLAHYYADRSLRSLVGAFGVSAQRVSQLHLLAVAELRRSLAGVS